MWQRRPAEPKRAGKRLACPTARKIAMLTIILIVLLVLWLGGSFPRAGAYNAGWGYAPVGIGTIIIIVILLAALTGRL